MSSPLNAQVEARPAPATTAASGASPGGWARVFDSPHAAAVVGAITIAFSSILVDLSHASPATAAIFRCVYALPVLGFLAFHESRRIAEHPQPRRRWVYLAGAFLGADLILWHHAIEDVGAGLATMLANVQVLILPFVGWLIWHERPSRRVLAAVPVAALGVVLISGVLGNPYGVDPTRGVIFGLLAGAAYVGFLLLMRGDPGAKYRVAGALFDATLAAAIFCTVAGLVVGEAHLVPTWPSAGWLVLLALSSQVFGWLMITGSMPHLPTATTSMILIAQPAATVIFAAIILDQIPSAGQLLGVAVILGCLAAVTLLPKKASSG
ncbi:MAG: DMT family transporter [Actinobacteria bacterium]|nr:DMT family transporter [Actinomycetota bacterium]